MGPLAGLGAVVTGGSRGIGRAIVRRLVADGATVLFTYHTDEAAATEVVRASNGAAMALRADVSATAELDNVFAVVADKLDGLDILVNNAGLAAATPIAEMSEQEYDRLMAVNTKSVFFAIAHAARQMRDGGRIINISTLNTAAAAPGVAAYAGSKAAVEQFTRSASKELGGRGITVNAVSPGATDTDLLRGANSPQVLAQVPALTALGRLGTAEDIAAVVAFLAGPDGRWVTGQNLIAAGGLG
ncbi:SDR family oxidoreductase [Solwaraspora sp. WMMB335]|uniref:SDR family oxidoreductase n=1 Tax=Solwaraspora sp. WMMB335 TaxID=3404118 RepID=UPI003B95A264